MATITEDYVSFEIAKLLKEKGFDKDCNTYYDLTTETKTPKIVLSVSSKNWNYKWNPIPFPISAPTLQMAMKWIREVHNINIDIVSVWNQKRFEYQVFVVTPENAKHCYIDDKLYLGYEEAVEAGLKYSLENLI